MYRSYTTAHNTLIAAIDHLEAFPHRDHFLWLHFFDIHHSLNLVPDIATQTRVGISGLDYAINDKPGRDRVYNSAAEARYVAELKRLDQQLKTLLEFIQERYSDDEMLVVLFSDHGQDFLETTPHFLPNTISHVPIMLRGGGVPKGDFDEYVQLMDLAPVVLHFAGLPALEDIDARLPECFGGGAAREFAITECIYPGEPYHLGIKSREYELYMESGGAVDRNGRFPSEGAKISIYAVGNHEIDLAQSRKDLVESFVAMAPDYARNAVANAEAS